MISTTKQDRKKTKTNVHVIVGDNGCIPIQKVMSYRRGIIAVKQFVRLQTISNTRTIYVVHQRIYRTNLFITSDIKVYIYIIYI